MQTLLVNKYEYVRSTFIPRVGAYSTTNIIGRTL